MNEITREQIAEASSLLNTVSWAQPLIDIIASIPPELTGRLRAAHDAAGYCCSAHSEGLNCCLDILLSDPAEYVPYKITAAEELLLRCRKGLPT